MEIAQSNGDVVLVTTRFFDEHAEQWLRDQGYVVRRSSLAHDQLDADLSDEEVRRLLTGAKAWILATYPVTRSLVADFPELEVIARRGVGYNTIDTQAAAEYGKFVTIAPGGNEPSVADHAVAMMLAVTKQLVEAHHRLSSGNWTAIQTGELHAKTVGLLGFGRIAQLVARRVLGFETTVIACDPYANAPLAAEMGVDLVGFDELLQRSDFLSLHVPLLESTRNIINSESLSRMKPGAVLINTSRAGLVDERNLCEALRDGHLGGAASDVFEGEENTIARRQTNELLELPNFIGTAHIAGSSREGLARTNLIAARCVVDVLEGRSPPEQCVVVRPPSAPVA